MSRKHLKRLHARAAREVHGAVYYGYRVGIGIVLFCLDFFLFAALCFSASSYPSYNGFVNDYAHMMSQSGAANLEQELVAYEQKTSNEIAVVTIDSLGDQTIEEYVIGLMDTWKVGKKGKDNGVIFLISKNDKKIRIEVGYGLEPYLTDGDAGEIIRTVVSPEFRAGKFEQGIVEGTHAIIKDIDAPADGVSQSIGNNPVRKITGSTLDSIISNFGEFIFLIPMLFIYLVSYMARTKDIMFGGIVGAVGGGLLGFALGSSGFLLSAVAMGGVLGLVLDWILSRNYQRLSQSGHRTNWGSTWGGFGGPRGFGGGWGGGSSGGGFGGFGGGSGGGGGSSGGW